MKIIQIIKRLNNTELNKNGMKDYYVSIPSSVGGKIIFGEKNKIDFINKRNNISVPVNYTTPGNEHRFSHLGDFFRSNDLNAGDAVIFERKIFEDYEEHYLDFLKFSDNIVLQKTSSIGFEVLKGDLDDILDEDVGLNDISYEYLGEFKKRSDSPNYTKYFDILINEESILEKYNKPDMIEIKNNNGTLSLFLINPCIVYEMDV